jgi:hypothetical protein
MPEWQLAQPVSICSAESRSRLLEGIYRTEHYGVINVVSNAAIAVITFGIVMGSRKTCVNSTPRLIHIKGILCGAAFVLTSIVQCTKNITTRFNTGGLNG